MEKCFRHKDTTDQIPCKERLKSEVPQRGSNQRRQLEYHSKVTYILTDRKKCMIRGSFRFLLKSRHGREMEVSRQLVFIFKNKSDKPKF